MTPSSPVSGAARAFDFAALVRLLYTQNPFYLIGTFLVIFGLQQSLGQRAGLATSGLLIAMLAGYALLLAAVAFVIIRWGKVWDDARTILLVIVLLFFMLSSSLDVHILYEPVGGRALLLAGLLFSVLVSEGVLRGLRIRLAAVYRGPYYLMLTLLFVYPIALAWLSQHEHYRLLSWAQFAFPALAALALLTLLPAARSSARREPRSGTPWRWPYYPWSLFVYLTIGVAIRAWWLSIAFEPTEGTDTSFRLYYLSPLLIAWSALVLEMGTARASKVVTRVGLLLPLGALLLAFPGRPHNPVDLQFTAQLIETVGSPAQLTVWGLLFFYVWAWLRNVRGAEPCVLAIGGLASLIGPRTLDVLSFTAPQPIYIAALVLLLFVQAIRRESSWRALAGGAVAAIGLQFASPSLAGDDFRFWQWHAPVLGVLWLTAIFNDRLAKTAREVAWRITPALAILAALIYPLALRELGSVSEGAQVSYATLLLLTSLALWFRQRETAALAAVFCTLGANLAAHVRQVYLLLEQTLLADGLPWLAAGAVAVALGFTISLGKMGLSRRAWDWLVRMNIALGGAG